MKYRTVPISDDVLKAAILKGVEAWPSLYITEDGRRVKAARLADVKREMRGHGWRNVSWIDEDKCRKLGIEVVSAYYGQKAHVAKRFCQVVVLRDYPEGKTHEEYISDYRKDKSYD